MVTHLVADHVGGREVAGAAQARELVEEAEVEVELAVERAVEGARLGRRRAAARADDVGKEDECRRLVGGAALGEDRAPRLLGRPEDRGGEVGGRVLARSRRRPSGLGSRLRLLGDLEESARVDAEAEAEDEKHQKPDPAAGDPYASPAPVLDVRAPRPPSPPNHAGNLTRRETPGNRPRAQPTPSAHSRRRSSTSLSCPTTSKISTSRACARAASSAPGPI